MREEENTMSEKNEMNMEEMEQVSGGYKKPAPKPGFIIYQIQKGDALSKIARRYNTTEALIMSWNPKIKNKNLIYAGDYLYIKQ